MTQIGLMYGMKQNEMQYCDQPSACASRFVMSGLSACSLPYVRGPHAPDQIERHVSGRIAIQERVGAVMLMNEAIISLTGFLETPTLSP